MTDATFPAAAERPALSALVRPGALLATAVAAYGAAFGALAILRHHAFNTGRFDLGNMVQAVWATAHGHILQVTDLHGDQVSRLGSHFDPILVLFAPLWWVWPSPDMLLAAQAVLVGLGALPVYWLGRKHVGDRRVALAFALVYLLYPPTQWLTLNEFHPVALACPLLLFAFWYLDEDRLLPFGLFALLAVLTKEEIPLVLAAFGVWYAVGRRRWSAGAAIAVVALAVFSVALFVVIPHFNGGSSSVFYERYTAVGGSPTGIAHTALHDPLRLLEKTLSGRGLRYVAELLLPLAGLSLLSPLVALAAFPELAINLLSVTAAQTSIEFHYTAGLIAPLTIAAVLGAARLLRWRRHWAAPLGTAVVLVALAANFQLGAIPLWRFLPAGKSFGVRETSVSAHDRIAARAVGLIPESDAVSATNSLGAHLSARRRVYSFPTVRDASWIVVDEKRPSWADRLIALPPAARLVSLRRDPAWRLVFENDGILVFERLRR